MNNTTEQTVSPLNATTYMPEKKWWVWVDKNDVIQKTISSLFELTNLDTSGDDNLKCVRVGNVDEQLFAHLSKVARKSYYIGLLDELEQEIYSFKFKSYVDRAIKTDEHYVIDDSMCVDFKLLDENNVSVDYTGPVTLKCIGTTGINKQYKISTDNNTLQQTGDHSREYTMSITDKLIVNNTNMQTKQSIRATCNFVVNNEIYPLFRYITFGSNA